MNSFRPQLIILCFVFVLLICIVHTSRVNDEEQHTNGADHAHNQALTAARSQILKQILNRRSLYDPAFGDSWSNYLEKKRSLFDPAYGDWANTFKRSDE